MADKTLESIFLPRARGVGHLMRDRVWRMTAFASDEPLTVELLGGPAPTIRYRRVSDGDACIEIGSITPGPLAAVHWGEEQVLRSEQIGSTQQTIDNRHGPAPVSVKFADVFSETHSSSSSSKAGVSVSVTVKSTQKIGGAVGFEESITAAANREVSESEGSSSTHSDTADEATTVPAGKRVRITETRTRSDVDIPVTAQGTFTHTLGIGKHSGGDWKGKPGEGHGLWSSWDDFVRCVDGQAPDNWDFGTSLREHPPWHADRWALNPIDGAVAYVVSWEGRVVRTYMVEEF